MWPWLSELSANRIRSLVALLCYTAGGSMHGAILLQNPKLINIIGKVSKFGAIGDGSDKGKIGKVGKISNFGEL